MRFSNIHSWMSTEPLHWVARAMAIEVRSAGNAGHGPSWTLALYSPTSRWAMSCWSPGTIDVGAVELGPQAQAREDEPDHAQVLGLGVLDHELAAGDAGQRDEGADLDVVGPDVVGAAAQLVARR